jgi:protein-disulfide isomerase
VRPTIEQVMKEYPGKVRLLYRHNPLLGLHENAVKAAEASLAADAEGKFWAMHDKLFDHQQALTRPDLERYAAELGLNMTAFKAALDEHKYLAAIQQDMSAARDLGAHFTPVFFINGRPLGGAQPFREWKRLIDEEMATADALLAKGTPPAKLYETLLQDAHMPGAVGTASSEIYKVALGDAPARGGREPKVTIVEFCDFECPYCAASRAGLQKVVDTYGADVRVVWKHLPLPMHKHSSLAALASEAARAEGKFWEMHDLLFAHQDALDRTGLEMYAAQLKLDPARFKETLDKPASTNHVDADAQQAIRLGQRGTPAFFVNGRLLTGVQSFESWQKVIGEETKKADTKLAAGVPRARLYEELTKDGRDRGDPPPPAAHEVAQAPAQTPTGPQHIELGDAPMRGPRDALVTLVVFSDYQCPFCGRVEPTLAQVMDAYKGTVRMVWKDYPLPFHAHALQAAQAARAAGAQGKFWEMHDRLFANQQSLDPAGLEKHAEALGLDMTRFRAALDGQKERAGALADQQQGATAGVTGTPAFFINGIRLAGALPFESFKAIIDAQLAKAQALVAKGTPRRRVYDVVTGGGPVVAARAGRRPDGPR